jgi:ABC-type transport system involved in multi-copper enzyme maturation permease subunit
MTVPRPWLIGIRELRRASKSRGLWIRRTAFVLVALLLLAGMVLLQDTRSGRAGVGGGVVFNIAVGWAFLAALVSGPALAADLISSERRDGNLDLLFLAGIRPSGVVLGKLGYAATEVVPALMAMAPLLVLPVLVGGVLGGQVVFAMVVLFLTAVWSLTVALFFSALFRNGRVATGFSLVTLVAVVAVCRWKVAGAPLAEWLAPCLSPGEAMALVTGLPGSTLVHEAAGLAGWHALGIVVWLALACAAAELIRLPWTVGLGERLTRLASKVRNPDRNRRPTGWRRSLLEREPLAWLILRERFSGLALLAVVGLITMMWSVSLWFQTDYWLDSPEVTLGVTIALMGMVKLWLALDTTRRLAEDRESGALQVILTTGMAADEVIRGLERGLFRRYLLPVLTVVGLAAGGGALLLISGRNGGMAFLVLVLAVIVFVFDAFALTWTGLYDGLTQRNASRALVATVLKTLLIPWLVLGPVVAVIATAVGPSVDIVLLAGASWFAVSFLTDGILVATSGPGLADRLHHCAIGLDETPRSLWRRFFGFGEVGSLSPPVADLPS